MERLQKLIAAAGEYSRRAAEELILAGRVTLNGQVVTQLGTKAGPDDVICLDGKPLHVPKRKRTVLLHKPAGFVTTRHDPEGRPTVYDLLYDDDAALHPIGRLDRDTTGLLLLTNDGDLTARLTHPRYQVERTYRVLLDPWPTRKLLKKLRQGVELEDGPVKPKDVSPSGPGMVELVLCEGRYREVRRLFEALGHEVVALHRVRYGTVELGRVKEGKARPLNPDEVARLRELVGLD